MIGEKKKVDKVQIGTENSGNWYQLLSTCLILNFSFYFQPTWHHSFLRNLDLLFEKNVAEADSVLVTGV